LWKKAFATDAETSYRYSKFKITAIFVRSEYLEKLQLNEHV